MITGVDPSLEAWSVVIHCNEGRHPLGTDLGGVERHFHHHTND